MDDGKKISGSGPGVPPTDGGSRDVSVSGGGSPNEVVPAADTNTTDKDRYAVQGSSLDHLTGAKQSGISLSFLSKRIEAYVSRTLPYGVWLNDGSWNEVGPAYRKLTPMAREGVYVLLCRNVPPDDIATVLVGGAVDDFLINQIFETVRALHRYGVEGIERGFIPDIRKDDHRSDYKFLSGDSVRVGSTLWEYQLALWYAKAGMQVELEKEYAINWNDLSPEQEEYLKKEIEPFLNESFRNVYRNQDKAKVDLFVSGFGKRFIVETKKSLSPAFLSDPAKRAELDLQVRRHALIVKQHGLDGKDFVVRTWNELYDPDWAKNVSWLEEIHAKAGVPYLIRGGLGAFAWSRFGGFTYSIASTKVAMPNRDMDEIPAEEPVAVSETTATEGKRGPLRKKPVKVKAEQDARALLPWNKEIVEWLKQVVPQGLPKPKDFDRAEDFIAAIQSTMRKGAGIKTARDFADEMSAKIGAWLSTERKRLDREEKVGAATKDARALQREKLRYEEIFGRWKEFRLARGNKTQQGNLEVLVWMAALARGEVVPTSKASAEDCAPAPHDTTMASLRDAFLDSRGEFRAELFKSLIEVQSLVDEGKMELEIIRSEDSVVAQGDLEELWKNHADRMKRAIASIEGESLDVAALVELLDGVGAQEPWAVDVRNKGREILSAARDLSRAISERSGEVFAAIEEMDRFDVKERDIRVLFRPVSPDAFNRLLGTMFQNRPMPTTPKTHQTTAPMEAAVPATDSVVDGMYDGLHLIEVTGKETFFYDPDELASIEQRVRLHLKNGHDEDVALGRRVSAMTVAALQRLSRRDGRKIAPLDAAFDGFQRADAMQEVSSLTGKPIAMERMARGLLKLAEEQGLGQEHAVRLSPETVTEIRDLVRVVSVPKDGVAHDVYFVKWNELRRKGFADLQPTFGEFAAIIGKRTRLIRLLAILGAKGEDLRPGKEFWLVGQKLPNGEVSDLRIEPSKITEGSGEFSHFQICFRIGKLEGPVPVGISGEGALELVTPFRVGGVELGRAETALVVSWLVGKDKAPEGEATLQVSDLRELLAQKNIVGRLEQLHKAMLGVPLPSIFILSGKIREDGAVAAFKLVPGDAFLKGDPDTFELLFERTPKRGFVLKGAAGDKGVALAKASLASRLNRPLESVERALAETLLTGEPQTWDNDNAPTEDELRQFFGRKESFLKLEDLFRTIMGKDLPKSFALRGVLKEMPSDVVGNSTKRVSHLSFSERDDMESTKKDGEFCFQIRRERFGYHVVSILPVRNNATSVSAPPIEGKGDAMESRAVDLSEAMKATAPPAIGAAAALTAGATALSFGPVAPDKAMQVAARQTVTAISGMAKGGAVFGFGLVGADIVTGDWEALKQRSAVGFLKEYGALTAGNAVGQAALFGPNELIKAAAGNSAVAAGLGKIMNRSIPLFTALIALDAVQGRPMDAKALTLSAANILAASATVHTAIDLAKGLPWVGRLATACRIAKAVSAVGAPETGGATLLGLGLISVAEFVLLKKISDAEEWWVVRSQRQNAVAAVERYEELLARTGGGDETVTVGELAQAKRDAMATSAASYAFFEQRREVARQAAADELASWEKDFPKGTSRNNYHKFMIERALVETLAVIDGDEAEAMAPIAAMLARVEELERETRTRLAAPEPETQQNLSA